VLITATVALFAIGVIEGQARGWGSSLAMAGFAAGAAGLAGFITVEARRTPPLIDLSLFTNYGFAVANAAAFVVFFAFVGVLIYFSAYFQQVQGHDPVTAGVDLLAIGVAYAGATTIAGRLVGRVGERWPMLAGLVIAGLASLALLRLQPDTGVDAIWPDFAVLGAGIGLSGTPMSTVAMSAVGTDRAGMASAVVNALRQIGQVFGVAVLGALVYADLPGVSGTGAPLTPAQQAAFVTGLHHAMWVCGIALLAAAVPVIALPAHHRIHQ
jgi:MFS transporter, DHA2 family, methylenomycin A resistance protein